MAPRIAVFGSGANGSCVGADLTEAGHDVWLIDQWPAHVEAMREGGLRVTTPDGEQHVAVRAFHLCDLASTTQTFDIIFIAVKAYDTRWMVELAKPLLADDGVCIGLQNAMTAETIRDVVGSSRTLGCVVELSSEIFTPGQVQRNTPRGRTWFGLGVLDPVAAGQIERVVPILGAAGRVSVSDDVLSAKWMKLVVNVMCLAPCAALGLPVSSALAEPGMRELVLKAGAEAFELGQHLGYQPAPIFGLSEDDMRNSNRVLELLLDKLVKDVGPRARDCILQDHLKQRMSEVDLINGAVVEGWRKLGRAAPANARIAEISAQIRAGSATPDPSNRARLIG
jgi:2-dehydropantoate 2-reductase